MNLSFISETLILLKPRVGNGEARILMISSLARLPLMSLSLFPATPVRAELITSAPSRRAPRARLALELRMLRPSDLKEEETTQ